jgi:hypothetical protein
VSIGHTADVLAIPPGKFRTTLEELFESSTGRAPQPKQLDWLERVARTVLMSSDAQRGAVVIDRTIPQLVRGMGLPLGPTVHATRQRYRNQIFNTLGYLKAMGLVEGAAEAPRAADGRGRCILVCIPAGVAQSVRAAES